MNVLIQYRYYYDLAVLGAFQGVSGHCRELSALAGQEGLVKPSKQLYKSTKTAPISESSVGWLYFLLSGGRAYGWVICYHSLFVIICDYLRIIWILFIMLWSLFVDYLWIICWLWNAICWLFVDCLIFLDHFFIIWR